MSNPGKADPGWNDPPMFAYNPDAIPTKPRNLLNKRVPFSMNSTPPSCDTRPPLSMPPSIPNIPTKKIESPLTNTDAYLTSQNQPQDNSEFSLSDTMGMFQKLIEDSPELGKKAVDIEKRLNVMESMWREGKLNENIQKKTYEIAKALSESNTKIADDLHRSLMVDYVSVVSPWMVGVKQLILHYITKNELISIDADS